MEQSLETKSEKKSAEKKFPSLAQMASEDSELRDFLQFLHENGSRDRAVTLLQERLDRLRETQN